jgi:hypothetical protein
MFLADILGLSLKAEKNGQTVTVLIVPRPDCPQPVPIPEQRGYGSALRRKIGKILPTR